jgi:replication fork clamp-binding protein CrfC
MSLVDLPGMTRVPVQGQPHDISSRLRTLIMAYICNPSSIILAVSAANSDLANSDAIALARDADPEGARTIGLQPGFVILISTASLGYVVLGSAKGEKRVCVTSKLVFVSSIPSERSCVAVL